MTTSRLSIRGPSRRVSQAYRLRGLLMALGWLLLYTPAVQADVLDLTWDAPTTNSDGSALTDLDHYRVYSGTSSAPCPGSSYQVIPSPTPTPTSRDVIDYRLTGLNTGTTYYVRVTAVDTSGNESACSNEASGVAKADPGGGGGGSGGGDGGGGGGCFVATAAYGSPMASEVQLLREFRDRYLLSHSAGKLLVGVYYAASPPLARAIAQSDALRALVRTALHPVLWWVNLFFWSPVLAISVLLGTPIATSCLILGVTRRYSRAKASR